MRSMQSKWTRYSTNGSTPNLTRMEITFDGAVAVVVDVVAQFLHTGVDGVAVVAAIATDLGGIGWRRPHTGTCWRTKTTRTTTGRSTCLTTKPQRRAAQHRQRASNHMDRRKIRPRMHRFARYAEKPVAGAREQRQAPPLEASSAHSGGAKCWSCRR